MSSIKTLSNDPAFSNHIETLEELSRDDSHGHAVTRSQINAISFDEVRNAYVAPLKLKNGPNSMDAICIFTDGGDSSLAFIEFKNGKLDARDAFEIRKKIYDTLLIFQDLTGISLTTLRAHAACILVYRRDLNPDGEHEGEPIPVSPSRDMIGAHVAGLAHEEIVRFGLARFWSYCFKEVHTYGPDEFDAYLEDKVSLL